VSGVCTGVCSDGKRVEGSDQVPQNLKIPKNGSSIFLDGWKTFYFTRKSRKRQGRDESEWATMSDKRFLMSFYAGDVIFFFLMQVCQMNSKQYEIKKQQFAN
jgi:hypothetical protein